MPYRGARRVFRRRSAPSRLRYRKASRLPRRARRSIRRTAVSQLRRKWTNPIPQTARYRLTYIDNGFVGTPLGASNYQYYHVFYANSIYDPDYSGVGVQPYGYDQIATLFPSASYRVSASSITISFTVNDSTATSVKCYVFPYRIASIPASHDPSDLRTIPGARTRVTDGISGHTRKNWVKNYCTMSRMFRDRTTRDGSFTADIGANPSVGLFWIVVFDTSEVVEETPVYFDVKIVYYVTIARVVDVNES